MQFLTLYAATSPLLIIIFYAAFGIFYIFPAWFANAAPVIFGGGKPLDFGKKIGGKPIFGSHKTIKGTFAGLVAGYLVAFAQPAILPGYPPVIGMALSTGAIVGDLVGSFIKRRMGVKEGASVPIMDQYTFLLFALLFALPFGSGPLPSIFSPVADYTILISIVVLTGVLHVLLNMAAHGLRIKKVPW